MNSKVFSSSLSMSKGSWDYEKKQTNCEQSSLRLTSSYIAWLDEPDW